MSFAKKASVTLTSDIMNSYFQLHQNKTQLIKLTYALN